MCRSMTFRGGLISLMRATDAATFTSTRVVAAVAIFGGGFCGSRRDSRPRLSGCLLEVDGRLARLADRRQRIARAFFFFDPLLLIADDVEQQLFILSAGEALFTVLGIAAIVQWLASFAVVLLPCPSSDVAVEVDVGRVELLLARLQKRIQLIDQSRNFLPIEMA